MRLFSFKYPVVKMYSPSSTAIEYVDGSIMVEDGVVYYTGDSTAVRYRYIDGPNFIVI